MGLTDSEAAELARQLQADWEETNGVRGTRRQLRQGKLDPSLPPGWSKNVKIKHKTHEIDDAVRVLRNRMLGAPVSILVFAKSGTEPKKQDASRVRRFLDKSWLDLNVGYPNARFLGTDSQVGDGVWPAHLVWDQAWIDRAIEATDIDAYLRGAGLPFVLETPDPLNVYVEFNRKKLPRRVTTIEKVELRDVLNEKYTDDGGEYFLGYNAGTKALFRSGEPKSYDAYWGPEYSKTVVIASIECESFVHRVLIEGAVENDKQMFGLGKWPNLFNRPAWVFMAGDFANTTDPLERWKPLMLGMYKMGNEINMLRSARLNSGMLAGLPRILLKKVQTDGLSSVGGSEKPELTLNEDGTVTVPEGWEAKAFELPTAADSLLENALGSAEMEMARFKPSPALRGQREEGVSSGYQQALIAEAAMTDLDPPLEIQSGGIGDILRLVLDGAKAINEITEGKVNKLYVRNLQESGSDSKQSQEVIELRADEIDDFEITVRQSSMSPTSRIGLWEEGRRARLAGEIDDTEMYEHFFGYEDGAEMQKRAVEQRMFDGLTEEAIQTARLIVQQKIAATRPAPPPTIVGPTGEPISSAQPPPGGVPQGAAGPGMDATLAQPAPPGPQPTPVAPTGGQAGAGSMA